MIPGKNLWYYISLLSPNDYQRSDKIIYKYFKDKYSKRLKNGWRKKSSFKRDKT